MQHKLLSSLAVLAVSAPALLGANQAFADACVTAKAYVQNDTSEQVWLDFAVPDHGEWSPERAGTTVKVAPNTTSPEFVGVGSGLLTGFQSDVGLAIGPDYSETELGTLIVDFPYIGAGIKDSSCAVNAGWTCKVEARESGASCKPPIDSGSPGTVVFVITPSTTASRN